MKGNSFIRKVFLLVVTFFIAIMLTLGSISLFHVKKLYETSKLIQEHPLRITKTTNQLIQNWINISDNVESLVNTESADTFQLLLLTKESKWIIKDLNRNLDEIQEYYLGPVTDFIKLQSSFDESIPILNQIVYLANNGQHQKAKKIFNEQNRYIVNQNVKFAEVILNFADKKSTEFGLQSEFLYENAKLVIFGTFLIIIIIGVLVILYASSSIAIPVSKIISRLLALKGSNIEDQVSHMKNNEIKILNHAVTLLESAEEQRKHDETYISSQQTLLNDIINKSIQGVITINSKGIIQSVNSTACEMFQYNEKELEGKSIKLLMPEEVSVNHDRHVEKAPLKSKYSMPERELEGKKKDGSLFPIRVNLIQHKLNDEILFTGFVSDQSVMQENKKLEIENKAAEQSLDFKSRFLANMSHEIRTPLNGIIGMNDILLMNKNIPEEEKDYLKVIKTSSEGLLAIVNDILDISKIEAGELRLYPVESNVRHIVKRLETLFQEKAGENMLELKHTFDPDIPRYVMVDQNRVSQIVSNFLSNAIKFSSNGEIHTSTQLIEEDHQKVKVRISVKDYGKGISKEDQQVIFADFKQLDEGLSKGAQGTGLGLSICKSISKLLGGEIGVTSELGKGSEFFFTFEAEKMSSIYNSSELEVSEPENFIFEKDILLVDDKEINRKISTIMLEQFKCRVETANDGAEAVEKAKNKAYDLILMDIQMPVMDGVQATQVIREELSTPPIIIGLSANAMEGDAQKYMNEGMDDYLAKPITAEMLGKCLAKWL